VARRLQCDRFDPTKENPMKTIDTTQLAEVTGGAHGWWLANHPFAAAGYFANHPWQEARFVANHPIAGARIERIQQRWGI
jgi:hypothetical protein